MDNLYHFSAPGRVEISGNHTDHQNGCVLAAAINMEARAEVRLNSTNLIHVDSVGYEQITVDLSDLTAHKDEKNTSTSLVRGIASAFSERGYKISGFDARVTSNVLPGSGLSSSAAFEVLFGRIFNSLFADEDLTAIEIAQIGQYVENVYFGKPSGLMDQMASSVGGLVYIDFITPQEPIIDKIDYDFSKCGYALCIVDSGASHADLTTEYTSIPSEMNAVAHFLNKEVLRDVNEAELYSRLFELRKAVGDRAVLRAIHFFEENKRVQMQRDALKNGNFDVFLNCVKASGTSSWELLQNITPIGHFMHQDMALTLALCKKILENEGAVRVHGGGFAGTVLCFVPDSKLAEFKEKINTSLGDGRCHLLQV